MAYSSYEIANFIIDSYDFTKAPDKLTNLKINKLIYFLHVEYLLRYREPLVRSRIEAWEHGPVFREIYRQFKSFGDSPIRDRASTFDPKLNAPIEPKPHFSTEKQEFLRNNLEHYAKFTAMQLRNLSHVSGGPWDRAQKGLTLDSLGGAISNAYILEFYSNTRKAH